MDLAGLPPDARCLINRHSKTDKENETDRLIEILAKIPETVEIYKRHNIDDRILRDTLSDIGVWVKNCRRDRGVWGLDDLGCSWLAFHVKGLLFKIGRIQCQPGVLDWNIRVFRNTADGRVVVLPDKDERYNGDGQVSGTNDIVDTDNGYTGFSRDLLVGGVRYVEGTVIPPLGHAENIRIRLDTRIWAEVLSKGAHVLFLHIPQDEKFTPDVCKTSFISMKSFAQTRHAALCELSNMKTYAFNPFVSLALGSWLLDAQLDGLLPPEANLVKFLREFYLFPVFSREGAAIWRVFGKGAFDPFNPTPEQTKTSLQRAIIEFKKKGGKMRNNYGFILFDDIDDYGSQKYRSNFYIQDIRIT